MTIYVASLSCSPFAALKVEHHQFEGASLYEWLCKSARSGASLGCPYEVIPYFKETGLDKINLYGLRCLFDRDTLEDAGGLREHLAKGGDLGTYVPCSEEEWTSWFENNVYTEGEALADSSRILVVTDNDEWPIIWALTTTRAAVDKCIAQGLRGLG